MTVSSTIQSRGHAPAAGSCLSSQRNAAQTVGRFRALLEFGLRTRSYVRGSGVATLARQPYELATASCSYATWVEYNIDKLPP